LLARKGRRVGSILQTRTSAVSAMFDGILSRDQIRTLIGVAEHGSFHRAAAQLGVRQPAISQQIQRLEEKLGRRLFDRSPTGVSLTLDGEAVLIYARAMAKLGAEMSRHFSRSTRETVIRIGIGEEFGRTALPTVLALFARMHVGFRFEALCTNPSRALFGILDDGALDVVVARQDPARRPGETVWAEPTIWAGRPDLTLLPSDPVPLVLPDASTLRDTMLSTLTTASRPWRVVFEGGSLAILEAAVRAGLGVSACTARLDLTQIVPVEASAGLPALPPSVFVLERAPTTKLQEVDAFCDVLRTAAQLSFADVLQDDNQDPKG
jgi:DNA-binding transcriptional LysR family regulator